MCILPDSRRFRGLTINEETGQSVEKEDPIVSHWPSPAWPVSQATDQLANCVPRCPVDIKESKHESQMSSKPQAEKSAAPPHPSPADRDRKINQLKPSPEGGSREPKEQSPQNIATEKPSSVRRKPLPVASKAKIFLKNKSKSISTKTIPKFTKATDVGREGRSRSDPKVALWSSQKAKLCGKATRKRPSSLPSSQAGNQLAKSDCPSQSETDVVQMDHMYFITSNKSIPDHRYADNTSTRNLPVQKPVSPAYDEPPDCEIINTPYDVSTGNINKPRAAASVLKSLLQPTDPKLRELIETVCDKCENTVSFSSNVTEDVFCQCGTKILDFRGGSNIEVEEVPHHRSILEEEPSLTNC